MVAATVAGRAAAIVRGLRRHLGERGFASLTEFLLGSGHRADVLAFDEAGTILIAEVKSGPADFRADRKWQAYGAYCDRFYFAVDPDFPQEMLPLECGLIVADSYGAAVLRESPAARLAPARRRVLIQAAAHLAARRLHRLEDPDFDLTIRAE